MIQIIFGILLFWHKEYIFPQNIKIQIGFLYLGKTGTITIRDLFYVQIHTAYEDSEYS